MGLVDQIVGAESGGDPNARNSRSSASGLGQFVDSTWTDMLSKNRPDLIAGKSPEEIAALKSDPDLSRQMTEAYAKQNGEILSKAGLPVTPGSTYLAHFAGPQGAVSVLQADPNAPVSSVLTSAAVKANPFLQGMTAGQLAAWADHKMGGAQSQPVQQPSQASPASPAIAPQQAPLNLTPQPPPIFAGQPSPQPPQFSSAFGGSQQGMSAPSQMPPIFAPQRKPIDLRSLQAALAASRQRAPIFG